MARRGIIFQINPRLFLKEPQQTGFGQKILSNSILLIDRIGFEAFTFKKLAAEIHSSEASVYRYFENKHYLLIYLMSWYWEWVNYLIDINLRNITDPDTRLKIAIHNIVNASTESPLTEYINENKLHQVIINEGSKSYHIHNIDKEYKHGFFKAFKELVDKVSFIIKKASPNFPYPKILASNLFEMSNNQIYFAEHLPILTEIKNQEKKFQDLEKVMLYFAFTLLKGAKKE